MTASKPSRAELATLESVRNFSHNEDPAAADQLIDMLSQALSRDVLIAYFTRDDPMVSAELWQDQMRGATRVNPSAQQLFCLRDLSAAAFVLEFPRDAPSTWTSLLRMMPTVPLGKWRALVEWINSKEKQKVAFAKAHGSFLYLMAIADSKGRQDTDECIAVLQAVCRVADAGQQLLYVEARPKQRAWLKSKGFVDVMCYKVRKSEKAPQIFILARYPVPLLQKHR